MILSEKENTILKDLQTQEKVCMEHYNLCASAAKDGCLKDLFTQIAKDEQDHYHCLPTNLRIQRLPKQAVTSLKRLMAQAQTRRINNMTPFFALTASGMKKWCLLTTTRMYFSLATAKCVSF